MTDQKGNILRQWEDLINKQIDSAPLNRNQIFDADFKDGDLLLAYWGNRSFNLIQSNGIRKTMVQHKEPLVPHWVAFYGEKKLLFSSKMLFNGETPKPNLMVYSAKNEISYIITLNEK